jgi:Niemann-Pick C1 protein
MILLFCSSSPLCRNPTDPKGKIFPDIPCLGAFGGPVDPNVALGGFSRKSAIDNFSEICNDNLSHSLVVEPSGSPDYQTAEALIITFVVNNHLDEGANKMAETWEKAFLEYLDNYNSSKINITYSAEVWLYISVFTPLEGKSFNRYLEIHV